MIKLFTDTKFPKPSNSYYIFPLMEQLEKVDSEIHLGYSLVDDIKACDYTILPVSIEYLYRNDMKKMVSDFFITAEKYNKPILIFSGGDFGVTVKRSDVYTIRLGGFDSKMDERSFIMPPFINDPNDYLSQPFSALSKPQKPTIGFVGHSNASVSKYIKEYLVYLVGHINRFLNEDATDYQKFYPSSHFRFRYLSMIQKEKRILSNFVFRKKYRAGVTNESDKNATTLEFYQNICDNLYTFCIRGTGNFSVRFYETLAMGRIPVLVDTDCRLPFSDKINWNQHCVIVEESNIITLPRELLNFHESHNDAMLKDIQLKNRDLWLRYFNRDGYFLEIASLLQTSIKSKE